MGLEIYSDDARTLPVLQENVFTALQTTHALVGLLASDVQTVYKYNGVGYDTLAEPADYTFVGTDLVLAVALVTGEHIVVLPNGNISLTFTGTIGSSRSQTRKLVFHKGDVTTIYDSLNLFSENLTVAPITVTDTIYGGIVTVPIDASFNIYNAAGIVVGDGIVLGVDLSAYWLPECALIINGQYVGDILGHDATTIVLPTGTVVPTNMTEDTLEILSTGSLRFALGTLGGAIPADAAFKRMLSIPTLTAAEPTQYVWMRETVIIPSDTTETPNMPFKLTGQTYAQP